MNILITGLAGCGKSTISKKLNKLGYISYDIESIEGLFKMNKNEWVCDIKRLEYLIKTNLNERLVFFCGMASNFDKLISLFDVKLLLVTDEQTTLKRLRTRKKSSQYGHTEEVRQNLISWKSDWESRQLGKGLIKIDANKTVEEVVNYILEKTKSYSN